MSSNKQIFTEEMLNPSDDLAGYIDSQTAESLGIEQYFYSVWSHYNKGNSTQILIPLDEGKTPYARVIRPHESYDINYRLLTNADLDGVLVTTTSGATAIEAGLGDTRYRLQINPSGNVVLYQSTDGGNSWPNTKNVFSFN